MKKIKEFFSKNKEVVNSDASLEKQVDIDSNMNSYDSSLVLIDEDEEISLMKVEETDKNLELTASKKESLGTVFFPDKSSSSKEESGWTEDSDNTQEYLDKNYPKEQRNKIKKLYIREKSLKGHLDLNDFVNLEELDCSYNELTSLDISNLKKLAKLECNCNLLNNFNCSSLSTDKLTHLNISNNDFQSQDLSVFSQFTNLRTLWIGSDDKEKIQEGFYNRFVGSLESLRNLTKLKNFHISNTDITGNADCLPDSLGEIYFSSKERSNSKVKEITEQLNSFLIKKISNDWKDIHPELDKWKQREWEAFGFDYQKTKGWIKAGLKSDDYHFASFLREKGYNCQQKLDWEIIRKENKRENSQEWLNKKYPLEKRDEINWLDISKKSLEGELIIENLPNLDRLDCSRNQLTSLVLINLPKLTHFVAYNNKLANLIIIYCPKITFLRTQNNLLTNLDFLNSLNHEKLSNLIINNNNFPPQEITTFSKFVNLRELRLTNNRFRGSLKSLKNLSKLEYLSIANNEIDNDLEYLPDSLKEISSDLSQTLTETNSDFKLLGWIGTMKGKNNNLSYYDFKHWKENQYYFKWLKEEIEKLNLDLDIYGILKNVFFNVKTGEFVGNHQTIISLLNINKVIIDEKEKEIDFLELHIKELSNRINDQWKKVHNAYLYCVSKTEEKELLDCLIKKQVEFAKFKKQEFNSSDYRKKCREYKDGCRTIESNLEELLEGRLERQAVEEIMNKVEQIITECEELANWQLELEEKKSVRTLLLQERSQLPQIASGEVKGKFNALQIGDNEISNSNSLVFYREVTEMFKELADTKSSISLLLEKKIQIKKTQRQVLLVDLQSQSTDVDDKDWLKTLLAIQKKDPNSTELGQVKEILESHKINRNQLEKFCQIQKEICELKKRKIEQEQSVLTSQIEVVSFRD